MLPFFFLVLVKKSSIYNYSTGRFILLTRMWLHNGDVIFAWFALKFFLSPPNTKTLQSRYSTKPHGSEMYEMARCGSPITVSDVYPWIGSDTRSVPSLAVLYKRCLQLLSKRGRDSAAQLRGNCHSHAPLAAASQWMKKNVFTAGIVFATDN